MPYIYSDPSRETDPYTQPNIWITHFTATEVAEGMEEEIYDFGKRPEFKLYSMNSSVHRAMLDTMVEELDIKGGWCWAYCLPGCLPDGSFSAPFETYELAEADARENAEAD